MRPAKNLIFWLACKTCSANPNLFSKVLDQLNIARAKNQPPSTAKPPQPFIHVHSRWPDNWKSFFKEHLADLPELTKKLKRGLDDESDQLVNKVLELHQNILVTGEYQKDVKYSERLLFHPKDLLIRDEVSNAVNEAKTKYRLPIDKYEETVFFYRCGLYFLSERIDIESAFKHKIVVDGGGFIGDSALILSELNCDRVIVFEPDPKNLESLQKALNDNNIQADKVAIERLGLGSVDKVERLIQNNSGSSFYNDKQWSSDLDTVDVPVTRLDSYTSDSEKAIGLIKLDIQGLELEAIQGAIETIKRDRPVLAVSVYHTAKDFFGVKTLIDEQIGGYRFIIRKTNPFHPIHELMLIGYPEELQKP